MFEHPLFWGTDPLSNITVIGLLVPALVLCIIVLRSRSLHFRYSRPPGPPGRWFVGNAPQIPDDRPWLWYHQLYKEYGDVVRLSTPGHDIILMNTLSVVQDLFLNRPHLYSNRPWNHFVGDIVGMKVATFMSPYGNIWRVQRRIWAQHLGARMMPKYHDTMRKVNLEFIRDVHLHKKNVHDALNLMVVRIILLITYGRDAKSADEPWLKRLSGFPDEVLEAMTPGRFLVEYIPALKYIPSWFPGAGWKRYGEDLKARGDLIAGEPYEEIKRALKRGDAPQCVTTEMLEHAYTGPAGTDEYLRWISGGVYGAGVDTTQATLRRFILAMVRHPEIQERAQKEIFSVTEGRRLPNFDDEASLPYVNAIIKECHRWKNVQPAGVPHQSNADDVYRGLFIAKNSLMIPNIEAITNDPNEYPEPHLFRPERFLGPNPALDPAVYTFGFGRRICAGKHMADASIFGSIILLLSTTTFSKPKGKDGSEVEPIVSFSGSFINHLARFDLDCRPSSEEAFALVRDALAAA